MNTIPYNDVLAQVESLCAAGFSTSELPRIKSLINGGMRSIYGASAWWERYLVVGEKRLLNDGRILRVQPNVVEITEGSAKGIYTQRGTENGKPYYNIFGLPTSTTNNVIVWTGSSWEIVRTASLLYDSLEDVATPDLVTEWGENNAAVFMPASAVTLLQPHNIQTLMHVAYDDPRKTGFRASTGYSATNEGYEIMGVRKDTDFVYCTYKKPLNGPFGTGGGENANVPLEFADYVAHYAARMYQVGARQSNPNPLATIGIREIETRMQDALMQLEEQNYATHVAKDIWTHNSQRR
jgi:hypothetical protein